MYNKVIVIIIIIIIIIKLSTKVQITWQRMSIGYLEPLVNNNFEFQILKQFSDPEGRFVFADVKTEGKILTLAKIYAPNDDNPTFFKNVLNQLTSFECGEIVLGGDYNLVLEVEKDKIGGNPTTHKN